MNPNPQEPEPDTNPPEDEALSPEDEALLAELGEGGGGGVDVAVGVESCLTCSLVITVAIAVVRYFFS